MKNTLFATAFICVSSAVFGAEISVPMHMAGKEGVGAVVGFV